jgi:hypothetical protein
MPLEEADLKDEQELEYLLKKDPEQIEKGLIVIANQVITPKGRIDLLCVDKEKVLTVVEIKLDQDDDHLMQTISYYDWVFENMEWIRNTYPKFGISDEYPPKIILVARNFTENVIIEAKYFAANFDIKLYIYQAVKVDDRKFIICNEIVLPKIPEFPEKPKTIRDHLTYITDEEVQEVCNKTIQTIENLGENIETSPKKWGITFKYKGRNFAAIYPRRAAFVIDWKERDEWHSETGIRKIERAQQIAYEKIRKSYVLVGGTPTFSIEENTESQSKNL